MMNTRSQRDRRMEKEQERRDGGGGRWLKPEPEDVSGGGDREEGGRNLDYCYDQGKEICSGRRRFHGGRGDQQQQQKQLMKLSAELSKEPLRRPGAVPFLWEQSPGKRKSPPPTTLRQLFRQSTDAAAAAAAASAAAAAAADHSYDFSDTCSFVSAAADDARSFASVSEIASDEAAAAAASRLFLLHRFLPAAHAVAKPAPGDSRRDASAAAWPSHGIAHATASRLTISDAIASPEALSDVDSDDDSIPASPSSGACAGFLALRIFRFRNSDSMGLAAAAAARLSSCASFSSRRSHRHRRALRQLAHYREAQRSSPSFPSFPLSNRFHPTPDSPSNSDSAAAMSTTIKDVLHCGSSSADLLPPSSSLAESPPTSSSRSSVSSSSYVYNSPKLVVMEINNQEINSNQGMTRRSRADLMGDAGSDQGRALDGMKSACSSSTSSSRSSRTNYCSINTGISSPNYSNWSSNSNVCSLAAAGDEEEDGVSSKNSTNSQRSVAPPPLPKSPTQSWLMQSLISGKAAAIRSPSRLAQMQRASPISPHASARMNGGIAHLQPHESSRWDPPMNQSQRLQIFPQDLLQQPPPPNALRIGA